MKEQDGGGEMASGWEWPDVVAVTWKEEVGGGNQLVHESSGHSRQSQSDSWEVVFYLLRISHQHCSLSYFAFYIILYLFYISLLELIGGINRALPCLALI